tara:strand:- start:1110 stop:2969 length:1860 start_codon:yes stop_codon:yes gene_type:complete
MANIKKTFNFRNGVQVDDDNLIVNQNGLVGVGTTVPTEALDVRGKVKVIQDANVPGSGEINATTGIITSLTVTDTLIVNSSNVSTGQVGQGVIVGSPAGIVTATSVGIVTYYGDGQYLENVPTSQWENVNIGLGYTSIYARGNVGVNTVDPRFSFQVGGNNNVSSFVKGVGINSSGDIVATGILTATSVESNLVGNLSSGIATITNIKGTGADIIGIVTATEFKGDVTGNIVSDSSTVTSLSGSGINVTGIITAGTGFTGTLTGDVTGNLTGGVLGDVISGISTITILETTHINSNPTTGIITTGILNAGFSNIGVTTSSILNVSDKLGIGVNNPIHNLQVYSTGISTATIIGNESATLYVSQRVPSATGIGESVGGIRFGNDLKSLDIFNGDLGDVNNYIHLGSFAGINTGSFRWFHKTNNNVMTLTYDGKLGINKPNPETALDVVGLSTFTGNVKVAGNLEVTGTLSAPATIPDIINGSNINATSGISTFNHIDVANITKTSKVAIGTAFENVVADIDAQASTALFNKVGIGSTMFNNDLQVDGNASIKRLGVGTDGVRCAVDFQDAGEGGTSSYMLPPKVTTTIRNTLPNMPGALVYNETVNKLQVYNGSSWVDLH